MVTSVVVPLNGSQLAEASLGPAFVIARRFAAPVVLFRTTWSEPEESQRYLDEIAARLGDGVLVSTTVGHGFPATALEEILETRPDAVVCMSSHGHSGVTSLFLGSTAEELLRVSAVPVILVGPACTPDVLADTHGKVLVLAHDGSDSADALVPVAVRWAQVFGLGVHIVMVLHRSGEFLGNHAAGPFRARAAEAAEKVRAEGIATELAFPDDVNPARGLTEYTAQHPVALLVAGRKAAPGVAGAVLGSVALRTVRHSTVPVLAV